MRGMYVGVKKKQGYLLHQNVIAAHSAFNGHKKLNSRSVVGLLVFHTDVMPRFLRLLFTYTYQQQDRQFVVHMTVHHDKFL